MVDLTPTRTLKRRPKINYLIEIDTKEVYDEQVELKFTVEIFGTDGEKTSQNQHRYRFENGKVRKFKFVDTDIGDIQKLRLGIREHFKYYYKLYSIRG